jgi:hypothetical protein
MRLAAIGVTVAGHQIMPPNLLSFPVFQTNETRLGQMLLPLEISLSAMMMAGRPLFDQLLRIGGHTPIRLAPLPAQVRVEPNVAPVVSMKNPTRAVVLTPITLRVEMALRRLANANQPMPSNVVIAETVGGVGREAVRQAIGRLVSVHRITVESTPGKRRILVAAIGRATAWGEFTVGAHAPHSARAKGTPKPVVAKRPDWDVEDDEEPIRYRIEPMKLVATRAASTCQWPTWGDGAKPTHVYCDAITVRGKSLCLLHI